MGSSFLSPPAKRAMPDPNPFSSNGTSSNKRSKPQPAPLPVPSGYVSFRLLCHGSRIGGVIGKSGSIVKSLQLHTGAKIRIEEAPPECPDRVITIIGQSAVVSRIRLNPNGSGVCNGGFGAGEMDVSKGQEALVRVFERILEVAAESDGAAAGMLGAGGVVSCRMLAEASHVGAVIGKGGKVVEKIRKDCGVKIRVLTEKLPACASSTEEVIEIEGDVLAVKKALISVSARLQDCQQVDKTRISGSKPVEAVPRESFPEVHVDFLSQRNLAVPTVPSTSVNYVSGVRPLLLESDRVATADIKTTQQDVVFRILCSNDRVGGVIGKGGSIVKALQNETGASIFIGASTAECDERLITITASENPESRYSAAQKTVVLVFSRSVDAGAEKGVDAGSGLGSSVTARLVVSPNQVGCLLGKGGAIVSEMRRVTGAGIKIIAADHVPKCVPENDQVVQISGDLMKVKDAMYHITGRLRDNLFSSLLSTPGSISSALTENSPYERLRDTLRDPIRDTLRDSLRDPIRETLREPIPLTFHSSIGPPPGLNRHSTLTHGMDHLGLSSSVDHPSPPRLWSSQAITGVNPKDISDFGRGLSSFKGGLELGSGSKSIIVTNTTVEIVVPENIIGSVYGENGNNLARLRQISGAKVIVHEPRLGSSDRIVVISGTPDETQAAQSLLQAFILTGKS